MRQKVRYLSIRFLSIERSFLRPFDRAFFFFFFSSFMYLFIYFFGIA